jgi:hypothetical protein
LDVFELDPIMFGAVFSIIFAIKLSVIWLWLFGAGSARMLLQGVLVSSISIASFSSVLFQVPLETFHKFHY